jgi:hypothetical protein
MVAGRQEYAVLEVGCTGSKRFTGGCSISDNGDDAIMHNDHNIQCKTRDFYTVTYNLNA